jgi:hypothetical protein
MKEITIPARKDAYDEETNTFVSIKSCTLKLEHSLLSIWKWESKHHKYFLENHDLSYEEILDYIKCMTLNQVDENVYKFLTKENIKEIKEYIEDPMTATWFDDSMNPNKRTGPKEIVTAEVIYSSMFILNIPLEFEKRPINHLLTLIRVCNDKQNPEDNKHKMSEQELFRHYNELNKKRKAEAAMAKAAGKK